MTPHREDFARWIDDPVTRWVLGAFMLGADQQKQAWIQASWENGGCSKEMLSELRTRADAYSALAEMTYEDVCKQFGVEPIDE